METSERDEVAKRHEDVHLLLGELHIASRRVSAYLGDYELGAAIGDLLTYIANVSEAAKDREGNMPESRSLALALGIARAINQ
ncbi:hypothetical protein CTZ27_03165 [Streptomyces griseocarneus]|nr:hypothetical protein CTZ27_03165 [Streptomyces griseocarneus]